MADDPMSCGHPRSAVVSSGEGTNYCGMCADQHSPDAVVERCIDALCEASLSIQYKQELLRVIFAALKPRDHLPGGLRVVREALKLMSEDEFRELFKRVQAETQRRLVLQMQPDSDDMNRPIDI